jgi:hypothetical protein
MVYGRGKWKMSSTSVNFKRRESVKDLYNPKLVLQSFDVIEFSSLKAFTNVINKGLLDLGRLSHLKINILDLEDWKQLKTVLMSTNICVMQHIDIIIPQSLLFKILDDFDGIEEMKFNLIVIYENRLFELNDLVKHDALRTWIAANPLYIKLRINKDNYVKSVTDIGELYTRGLLRFFDVSFDYTSFQSLTLDDLHKLEFWINSLGAFYYSGVEDSFSLALVGLFMKDVRVDADCKLYYTNSDILLFDLGKYMNENGETIPSKPLYLLRKYMDMKENNVVFNTPLEKTAWNLISWADNIKINRELIEVPPITCLIINWIYYIVNSGGDVVVKGGDK